MILYMILTTKNLVVSRLVMAIERSSNEKNILLPKSSVLATISDYVNGQVEN